jgi:hypothetical protein
MNKPFEQQKLNTKKWRPLILLSALFVAFSYVTFLIPFALYSIAQTSAMLGKRYGFFILVIVFAALTFISLLAGSSFLFTSAVLVLFSIPFFMIAIYLREKLYSKWVATVVLLVPFVFIFASFIFLPKINNTQYSQMISQIEKNIVTKKQEAVTQFGALTTPSPETQILSKYDELLSQVQSLENVNELKNYLAYTPYQRMIWFVFGPSSIFLFFSLLISFANILFLDLAFEQVEKIKAIVRYVLKNVSNFSYEFVMALSQIPLQFKSLNQNNFFIVKHGTRQSTNQNLDPGVKVIRINLLKPLKPKNCITLKGYTFVSEGKLTTWNFKNFDSSLFLAILSIVFMSGTMFWFGGYEQLITFMEKSSLAPILGIGCLFSFAILSILTLQGFFIFYSRVSNLIGLIFLLGLFILSSSISIGFFAILAIFSSIALLDYVYDWRKRAVS